MNIRKSILLSITLLFRVGLIQSQTPNIQLTSAISVSQSPIIQGSNITVTVTVKNNGSAGTFDFECDLYSSSGSFLTVIKKECSVSLTSGGSKTLTFNSNSPINNSPGNYKIGVIALFSSCFGCGGSSSCNIKTPSGFTNPVSVTVASCTAVSIGSHPQNKTVTAGSTANFSITANGTGPFSYFWYKNGSFTGSTGSSYTTPTLTTSDNGNTYYCIVTNCNNSKQAVSNVATLTVTSAIPQTPSGFQVINQNPTATTLRVVWNSSSGATSYDIHQNCNSSSVINTTNTFRDFTGLTPGQTYSFRVVAKNSSGSSLPTSCLSRTLPDYAPSLTSPSNGSTGVSTNPTFQWQASPNNSPWYQLEINTSNNFSGSVVDRILVNSTSKSYALNTGTTYYWRVASAISGSSGFVTGDFSAVRSFTTTGGCSAPSTISSPSNSTIISGSNASFSASFSGSTLSYQWQISTNNGSSYNSLSNGGVYSNVTSSTLMITGASLSMNGYRYRCNAQNSCGSATSNSAMLSVVTTTPPIANFTSTASNISAGGSVQFFDASTNTPTSWQWTFTGGNTPVTITKTSQNPSVTFNNAGSYKVSLIASNSTGSSSPKVISGYVTVNSVAGQSIVPTKSQVVGINSLQELVADPIQIGTGTYKYIHTDFTVPVVLGSLKFTRYYNSYNNSDSGALGYGWRHSFSYSVQNYGDTIWDITYPDGHSSRFIPLYNGNGMSFPLYGGTFDSLIKTGTGEFWMYTKEQSIFKFTSSGILSEISDPNGNGTVLNYTGNKLTSIRGPGSRTISLQYSGNHISSVTTPSGRICRFGYDNNDNLTYAISANGDTTKFIYDSNHLMKEIIDGLGNTMLANTYDNQGRVISQADSYAENTTISYNTPTAGAATIKLPNNDSSLSYHDDFYRVVKSVNALQNERTFAYDDENNHDTVTNEKRQVSISKYDSHGNAIVQILPGNQTYTIAYNKFQKPTKIINPKGFKTTFSYDANGNLLSVTFPDSSHRYFKYDPNGTLTHFITGANDTTYFYYHNFGDLAKITNPSGNKFFGYDSDGRLDSIQDENGNITRLVFDNNDNIIQIIDPFHQSISFTYDANDQLTAVTDKMGFTTRFSYDKKGRLTARRDAMNGLDSFVYDIRDNLIKWIDANGHETVYGYDKLGRQISVTNAAGQIKYEYDEIGNVKKFIDPKNQITAIGYSPANLVSSILNPVNHLDSLQFDNIGNVSRFINYRGKIRNYKYDALDRLDTVIDVDGETTIYAYDADGNLQSLKDGNGHIQTFAYNKGRLTTYKDAENNSYSFGYDSVGNVKTINKPVGSISKTYDKLNRLVKVTMTTGGIYTYTYDANDNIKTISNNSDTSYFFYDSLNRMVKYIDPFKNSVQYGYDKVGNVTKIIYPGTKTVQYTYDAANRLETVKDWKNNIFKYFYDSAGNVKLLLYPDSSYCKYTYDPANRITSKFSYLKSNVILYGQIYKYFNDSIEETRYGDVYPSPPSSRRVYKYYKNDAAQTDSVNLFFHDGNGNRTKEVVPADTITYSYTIDQLLSSLKQHSITTTFRYDGLGHRIARTKGTTETRYVLNLNSPLSLVLQTTDGSGKVQASYIYGLGLLEQIDSAGNELFYYFDTRHNTVAVKDRLDSVKVKYSYSLYGLVNKTDSLIQPFTFLGEFGVEQETDSCYYIRARYYDASIGRFLSKDPLFGDEFEPQSLNKYVYALNNPLVMYDATGLLANKDNDGNSSDFNFFSYDKIINQINEDIDNGRNVEATLGFIAAMGNRAGAGALIIFGGPEIKILKSVSEYKLASQLIFGGTKGISVSSVNLIGTTKDNLLNSVSNPKLRSIIGQLYRKGAKLGSGSTMDAFRIEGTHVQKLLDYRTALQRLWANKSVLSESDKQITKRLLLDIQNALSGY